MKSFSSERRSLEPPHKEHATLQNIKFLNFFVGNFYLPDPDSQSVSASTDSIESGSNHDPVIRNTAGTCPNCSFLKNN